MSFYTRAYTILQKYINKRYPTFGVLQVNLNSHFRTLGNSLNCEPEITVSALIMI